MSAAANTLWARSLVEELGRCGVRDVILAPGSRSTPLVLAFAAAGRFRLRVHLDERSAAFFALGVGKATRRPAAVVTTSGTATANLLPAVVEASMAEVPLLLLTADRPPRLRGADANQAIDQVGLYGVYPRAFFDLAMPTLEAPALRHLRALVCRAVATATETPAGPVHLNVPFDKPLEPVDGDPEVAAFAERHPLAASGRADGEPFVRVAPRNTRAAEDEIATLAELVATSPRTVLVAGPSCDADRLGPAVLSLGDAAGCPVLADPLSGARFGDPGRALVVGVYDLYLRDPGVRERLEPSLILRVGSSPTSSALQEYLGGHAHVRHVLVDDGERWKDHGATATDYVRADAADALLRVTRALAGGGGKEADAVGKARGVSGAASAPGGATARTVGGSEPGAAAGWSDLWRRAEAAARSALSLSAGDEPHEGTVLAAVTAAMPAGRTLFVSSSMPVRDLDGFGAPRPAPLRVLANRGASGIDGVVSTTFGVASKTNEPVVCVLGDIAFFHDQNGLLWAREEDARVVFVIIDNDGGGIFHMLPVREHAPHFTPYFATPHGLDLKHAAELHGIAFDDVEVTGADAALARALEAGKTAILRVRTDRAANQRRHTQVGAEVADKVLETLG